MSNRRETSHAEVIEQRKQAYAVLDGISTETEILEAEAYLNLTQKGE